MRYPAEQKSQTRQRILDAAAVVFRRQGFQGASVDHVMAEAGLTAGGFYAHFASKDALFSEAFLETLRRGRVLHGKEAEQLHGHERIRAIADKYLSPAHRRIAEQGCPLPPLLAELPRQGEATRVAFQTALLEIIDELSVHIPTEGANPSGGRAVALLALMIGGMSLSRAVADETIADGILASCRQWIDEGLSTSPSSTNQPPPK